MAKNVANAIKEVEKKEAQQKESTSPLVIENEQGEILAQYPPQLLDTIKETVAKNATDEELYMFLQVAAQYGLNPFLKEIWFTKFRNKQTGKWETAIMTSRDGYAKLAKQDINFEMCQSCAVYENDTFEMEYDLGVCTGIKHSMKQNDRGKLIGAYAVLHKKVGDPLVCYAELKEYDKKNTIWRQYPSAMIRKVAENDVYKRFVGVNGLATVEDMPTPYQIDAASKEVTDFEVIDTKVVE